MQRAPQLITILIVTFILGVIASGQDQSEVKLPAKENFHLFLLAGQSNMAGRGKVADQDKKIHARVFALSKEGKWVYAVDPIHYDKKVAGVGLSKSFAIALAEANPGISIGLIPAACGGSPISTWQPGGFHGQTKSHPYDDALKRTRRAMKDGLLKGVLWHQGESDSKPKLAGQYKEKLEALIKRFRKEFKAESLAFVIGQLGQFPQRPWSDSKKQVDRAHQALAKDMAAVGFVSSTDLTCKSDKVHFDADSLRKFGKRYAEAYLKMIKAK